MKKSLIILGIAVALFILGTTLYAQESNSSITIDMTKEVDGETKTFSKTYSSQEEMENDEDLKAFNQYGSQTRTVVVTPKNQNFKTLDGDTLYHGYVFDFDNEFAKIFKIDPGHDDDMDDSLSIKLNIQVRKLEDALVRLGMNIGEEIQVLDEMDWDEIKERHKIFIIEKDGEKREDFEKGPAIIFGDIEENEFGKKGIVKKSDQLTLDDLTLQRKHHSSTRLRLSFSYQEVSKLRIAIYDNNGDEVLTRYVTDFSGHFSEILDLGNQRQGDYLLEVSLDNKRLLKKITIN